MVYQFVETDVILGSLPRDQILEGGLLCPYEDVSKDQAMIIGATGQMRFKVSWDTLSLRAKYSLEYKGCLPTLQKVIFDFTRYTKAFGLGQKVRGMKLVSKFYDRTPFYTEPLVLEFGSLVADIGQIYSTRQIGIYYHSCGSTMRDMMFLRATRQSLVPFKVFRLEIELNQISCPCSRQYPEEDCNGMIGNTLCIRAFIPMENIPHFTISFD